MEEQLLRLGQRLSFVGWLVGVGEGCRSGEIGRRFCLQHDIEGVAIGLAGRFDSIRSASIQRLRMAFGEVGSVFGMEHHVSACWLTEVMAPGFMLKGVKDAPYDQFAIFGAFESTGDRSDIENGYLAWLHARSFVRYRLGIFWLDKKYWMVLASLSTFVHASKTNTSLEHARSFKAPFLFAGL